MIGLDAHHVADEDDIEDTLVPRRTSAPVSHPRLFSGQLPRGCPSIGLARGVVGNVQGAAPLDTTAWSRNVHT